MHFLAIQGLLLHEHTIYFTKSLKTQQEEPEKKYRKQTRDKDASSENVTCTT